MFKPFNRNQNYLLPPCVSDLIPKGDLVFFIAEAAGMINLKPMYDRYDTLGQNAYHPAMLLSVLFYSYAKGIFSSRKIAEKLSYDVRFMYLAGMQTPDFRTISDFRKDNIDLLKGYFVEIVRMCQKAGMVTLESISIDGTKMQASASHKKTKTRDALTEQLEAIQQEIDRLLKAAEETDKAEDQLHPPDDEQTVLTAQVKDLEELRQRLKDAKAQLDEGPRQKQINLTDPDCRVFKGVGPGYNSQAAVDCEHQIIVGARVVQDVNDVHQLLPMIEETEANTKSNGHPKQVIADAGYASAAAYKELEKNTHIDAYVPTREQVYHQRHPVSPFHKSRFKFDSDRLTCSCPLGHPMRIIRRGTNKSGEPYINFIGTECSSCSSRPQCTKADYRNIIMYLAEPLVQRMKRKIKTDAGRQAMRIRRQTVEPVFGILKEHLGFRRFRLRGLAKVNGEFALLCTAFNLRKLHVFLQDRPLAGVLAQIRAMPVRLTALLGDFLSFFLFRVFQYRAN